MRRNLEATLQQQVKTVLTACGYTVIEIGKSRGKSRCRNCGVYSYATGWQGNSVGAPDIYVHHKDWKHVALGIELKTEKGAVRKEQQVLADNKITVICRSIDEVIDAVKRIDALFNIESKLGKLHWM
jgi:hypothetical protein